ncbi:MAG: hypothetical protein R3E32_19980 [Chitinophagales bacterium]
MAVYQFHLTILPKKGVIEKFGKIPVKLDIDHHERRVHYELKKDDLLEDEDEFKDAYTHDWWSTTDLLPIEIIHQIDKKVKRTRYGDDLAIYWKTYTHELDNDAEMIINEQTGRIEILAFRADLRTVKGLEFLKGMVNLSKTYDWLLMDRKGNLIRPEMQEIKKLIIISNPYKFLKNPLKFLADIEKGTLDMV